MHYDGAAPAWSDRDRFVLSNGHACALQYTMLHLAGYPLSLADLQGFRQLGSRTPGHPENHLTPGVEVSTGPLGQGIANAVGLAVAERHLAATYNRDGFPVVDHYTYVICGDGCLQEGVSAEASSLAGHLGLGKLVVLYDDNKISIDGETDLSFTEDVLQRYQAYGWHTLTVAHGDAGDLGELRAAVAAARAETARPTLIKVRTTIGCGSKNEGTEKVHGSPLGAADLASVKSKVGG
jgi:transketolase